MKKEQDAIEWRCNECGEVGIYADIRKPFDSGVDCCPNCGTAVECVE